MRSRVVSLIGLAGMLTIGACSSSTEEKPAMKTANSQTATTSTNSSNGNTVVVTNGMSIPMETADVNAVAAEPLEPPNRRQGRLDKLRQSAGSSVKIDPQEFALKNARPAPENSTFTSYLSDAGYEIRTFQSHPQLLKVEKRIDNAGKQTLKIFLRNGQVVERPGKDIQVLATATTAAILATAGVAEQRPRQPAPGPRSEKKPPGN